MKAVVVYESFWGTTAAVARAIAEGLGGGTPALTTDEAVGEVVAAADMIVVGAPIHAFSLPTEQGRQNLAAQAAKAPAPPDLGHPSLRSWLASLPPLRARVAAFDTGYRWSPGSASGFILRGLKQRGLTPVGKGKRFLVAGSYGPPKEGELEKARRWGEELARMLP